MDVIVCSVMGMINLRYPMPVNMDVIRCVLVGWLVVVVILLWWFRLGGLDLGGIQRQFLSLWMWLEVVQLW